MKFLVITDTRGTLPPDMGAQLFAAARKWINDKIADGTIDVSYSFPAGGGVSIGNADSHEDLMASIRDFPLCRGTSGLW